MLNTVYLLTSHVTLNLTPCHQLSPKTTPPKPHLSHCMTISQLLSLTNKDPLSLSSWSFCCLWHHWSDLTVFLVDSAYLLVLSCGSFHTCRLSHLPLPFQLISLYLIPYHLCCSIRLCSRSHSMQSLHYPSQFSHQFFHHLTSHVCWWHTTIYILHQSLFASYLWSTVNGFSYFIIDVIKLP